MATITGTSGPDNLNGTAGDDHIQGLEQDDVIHGGDGYDALVGGEGNDGLFGEGYYDGLEGGDGDDLLSGGEGDDSLYGGAGDDRIYGGSGSDTLRFAFTLGSGVIVDLEGGTATGEGSDTLHGVENVEGTRFDDVITGNSEANRLYGGGGADEISGGDGNDEIDGDYYDSGATGIDTIDAGGGDDSVRVGRNDAAAGGAGFDSLSIFLFNQPDGITIDLGAMWDGGTGTVGAGTATGFERLHSISGTLGADIVTIGTSGAVEDGYAPPHVLGYAGDDRLTGGGDRDSLHGGDDNDLLVGLGGDDGMQGGDGADRIEGGDGDDSLVGGSGADVLLGGVGDDIYIYSGGVLPSEDEIVEDPADAGVDRIFIHLDQPVGDAAFAGVRHVEIAELNTLTDLAGPEAVLGAEFQATGIVTVIASADVDASQVTSGIEFIVTRPNIRPLTVTGGGGDDHFRFGDHTLPPFVHDYVISGGAGLDTLHFDRPVDQHGWAGGELFLSGFEAMILAGGTSAVAVADGPDQWGWTHHYSLALTDALMDAGMAFTIDARALRAGIVTGLGADGEIGGSGADADTIAADGLSIDASQLTGGRAVRVLAGAEADLLTGSVGNDALFGGDGADVLDGSLGADRVAGEAGNDDLRGGDGADLLEGGEGHDILRGGAGIDRMLGGLGNDLYHVDAGADKAVELSGEGLDTVQASVSYVLSGHVENLVLAGAGASNGTGNGSANAITGNDAANRLDGGAGADILTGHGGHDVYVLSSSADQIVEGFGRGTDTVEAALNFVLPVHFENLTLTGNYGYDGRGNSAANVITGNRGSNLLSGGRGDDRISGGEGDDQLFGGLDNDVLRGGAGDDRFYFNAPLGAGNADDILDFTAADDAFYLLRSLFSTAGAAGTLKASAFHLGTSAADGGDRILYDAPTGRIFFDPDGAGGTAAILFATVDPGTALSHADFILYG